MTNKYLILFNELILKIDRDLQQFTNYFCQLFQTKQNIQAMSSEYYYHLIQRLVKNILFLLINFFYIQTKILN